MKYLLPVLMVLLAMGQAEARGRRGRVYSSSQTSCTGCSASSHLNTGTDQEQCQAEADYMATNCISGHVGSCIGNFEGCGCGPTPDCGTCTPSRPMGLTGDACAQGRNGLWYRVRSWR